MTPLNVVLDPDQLVSQVKIGALLNALARTRQRCVDFSHVPEGPAPVPVFKHQDVKFFATPSGTVAGKPTDRLLRLFGTGQILIELPRPSVLVDIFLANCGGNPIDVTFLSEMGTQVCSYHQPAEDTIRQVTCTGADLSYVLVKVDSAECTILRVCYVPG